jgi:uncharacterized protein YegL
MTNQWTIEQGGNYPVPALQCDYENNREQRLPCVLVVDGSGSMQKDDAIDDLNRGLAAFARALKNDPNTAMRVQVTVIRFGGTVEVLTPWVDAMSFTPPQVEAGGETPMRAAVELAMDMVENQIKELKAAGIARKRPWIWLMSDGRPTDDRWQVVAEKARQRQHDGKFFLYPVSVVSEEDESHTAALRGFSARNKCINIKRTEFSEFFDVVSALSSTGSMDDIDDERDIWDMLNLQKRM